MRAKTAQPEGRIINGEFVQTSAPSTETREEEKARIRIEQGLDQKPGAGFGGVKEDGV